MKLENQENGFTKVGLGNLEIILPTVLDGTTDERIEVRANGQRIYIQPDEDLGLFVSKLEKFSG